MSTHVFKVVVSGGSFYHSCRPCLPREYVVQYWRGHESVALPGTKLFCFYSEYYARMWGRQYYWPFDGEGVTIWRAEATGVVPTRGRSLPHLDDTVVIEEWWRRTLALPQTSFKNLWPQYEEYDRWLNEHSGFPHNMPQEYPVGTVWADTITLLHNITPERQAA